MASKPQAASKRLIEDFEPTFEWIRDASSHTLAVNLPGFKKEELKIQIDNFGKLRVTGERALGDNKWRRFVKDFQTPTDCTLNMIKAKFEKDKLYVSMPKNLEAIQQDQLAPTQSAPTTKPVTSATRTAKTTPAKPGTSATPKTTPTTPAKPVTAPTTTKITPTIPTTSEQPVAGKTRVSAADKEKEKSSGSSLVAEKTTNEIPTKENGKSGASIVAGGVTKENGKSGASIVAGGVTQQVPIKEMADAEKRKMKEDETTDGKASLENQPSVMGRLAFGLKKPRSLALKLLVAVVAMVVLGIYVNNRLRASSQDLED